MSPEYFYITQTYFHKSNNFKERCDQNIKCSKHLNIISTKCTRAGLNARKAKGRKRYRMEKVRKSQMVERR